MKRFISVILAVVLVFSCTTAAFAAKEEVTPLVIVRGLDFAALTVDLGTEDERPALSVSAGPIIGAVFSLVISTLFGGMDGAVSSICDFVNVLFADMACDKDGNTVANVSVKEYPLAMSNYPEALAEFKEYGQCELGIVAQAADEIGAENVYYVTYDWRLDPYIVAQEINERVELALSDSGSDKVDIICCSLGGVMTLAYLDEYGYDKVESCLFLSSTIYGSYVASDALSGNIGFYPEILNNFLAHSVPDVQWLWTILDITGITKALCNVINNITEEYKTEIYESTMRDTFGTMPGLWAMMQTDEYDAAKKFVFGDKVSEYKGLIQRTDKFQTFRQTRDDFIKQMMADGVIVTIVTSYGSPVTPVYDRAYVDGDVILESELMSAGATIAPYGKDLGEDYVPADPTKLSPDNRIDASTCLLPDSTWFIRDACHVPCNYGSELAEMLFWLLAADIQPTVTSNELYPQFQYADAQQNLYCFE